MTSSNRSQVVTLACVLLLPLALGCGRDEPGEVDVTPRAGETAAAPAATAAGAEMPAELSGAWNASIRAWNQDDPAALAAHYTEDAVVQAGDSTYNGRAAIQQRWLAQNLPVISDLQATSESFNRQGNDIEESGRYTMRVTPPQGAPETRTGSYTQTWKPAADGNWRIRSATVRPDA